MKKTSINKTATLLLVAVLFFIIDRFFKFASLEGFFDDPVLIFGNFFSLNFVKNYYIAFSLPLGGEVLTLINIVLVTILLYYTIYLIKKARRSEYTLFAIITLGAISNLSDRLKLGYVVDYLDLKYFTIFNIADAMIVIGFIGVIYLYLFKKTGSQ